MSSSRPPLAPADFQRIYRVLSSVYAVAAPGTDAATFFSVAGAALIERFYRKKSQPIAGAAFYKLNDANARMLALYDASEQEHLSSERGFHCWLLCKGHLLDFMGPRFGEINNLTPDANTSRKAFQKPFSAMAETRLQMRKPGDFFMLPNVPLTQKVLADFRARDDLADLIALCVHWYRKPPAKMEPFLTAQRGDGTALTLTLDNTSIDGIW